MIKRNKASQETICDFFYCLKCVIMGEKSTFSGEMSTQSGEIVNENTG